MINSDRQGGDAPIVRIAHNIILEGIRSLASEIHVEAGNPDTRILLVIDGEPREVMQLPGYVHQPLVARFKEMAELDEDRDPSRVGRIPVRYEGGDYALLVSVDQTPGGESVVMRFAD